MNEFLTWNNSRAIFLPDEFEILALRLLLFFILAIFVIFGAYIMIACEQTWFGKDNDECCWPEEDATF